MDDSIRYAKKYLEDMLSFFGLNTEVKATSEDDVIELSVPSTRLNGFLIGQRGETLRSLQYMVSTALKNNEMEYSRVNIDIADYKAHRAERLEGQVKQWVEEVKESSEAKSLKPMNAADRRTVHKAVSEIAGVETVSEGEGRDRHIVIKPSSEETDS